MRNESFKVIKKKMSESDLDSFIIRKWSNLRYVTGFTGDYGYAVIGATEISFFTSLLYKEQAQYTVKEPFKVIAVKDNIFESFSKFGASFWGKKVGYESDVLTCSAFNKLKEKLHFVELIPTTGIVEEIREVKDSSEIQSITHAQQITESVFDAVLELVRPGVEELDLACEIDYQFRQKGGERSAFETIVASGQNSSIPHAIPSNRKLNAGDLVLFDMGTMFDGYASDMTRTVVLGKADSEQKKIYDLVLEAQLVALDSISAGMKCSEVYSRALNVFEKAGYGDKFIHSLGHGVGLEVHEIPLLSHDTHTELKENFVITVEPGIYIPGWGGIRIEDMVVVTDNGCLNLTKSPKTLLEL